MSLNGENNLLVATASLAGFLYVQGLTLAVGFAFFPPKHRLNKEEGYWNILIAWFIGFGLLTCAMVLLGSLWQINRGTLLFLNLLFWLVIAGRRFWPPAPSFRGLTRRELLLLSPFAVTALLMFLSSLVPPTKTDEIGYHLFYTKRALLEEGFKFHYSPFETLMFMGAQTYNIWSFALGGEYAPALNSFFCYLLSAWLLYRWTAQHFGGTVALLALLISACSLIKVIYGIAPGDQPATWLLLLAFMILSYDLYQEVKDPGSLPPDSTWWTKLSLLNLLFCLSILVKITSAALTVPLFLLFYAFFLRRVRVGGRQLFRLALPFFVTLPFFFRAYLLYGNPIFPLGLSWFGAGPFDSQTLATHILSKRQILVFEDLIASPFQYLAGHHDGHIISPLTLLSSSLGYFYLLRKRVAYAWGGILAAYLLVAYRLPTAFSVYYLGLLDFLAALGLVEGFRWVSLRWGTIGRKIMGASIVGVASLFTLVAILYTRPFVLCLLTNQDRASFLKPRIECSETIRWMNRHLPKGSLTMVMTRGRYYYDGKTESMIPMVFGKGREVFENEDQFYRLLKQNGVTHLMTRESFQGRPRRNSYFRFCQSQRYAEKIYENPHEIVIGRRWGPVEYGKTAVYQLR